MTKKDYILISNAISDCTRNATTERFNSVQIIARSIASKLQSDNPRFDVDKFLTACNVVL